MTDQGLIDFFFAILGAASAVAFILGVRVSDL